MNIKQITMLLTIATLTSVTLAQEKQEFPKRERGNKEMRQKMMLRRFDEDGDGKLNEAEKTEAAKGKKEIITKYDKDGDGKLSKEERKAFMDERRKKKGKEDKGQKMGKGEKKGKHGEGRINPEQRKQMMKKFDTDGDGKLSKDERKALEAGHKKTFAQFDADGDGKLSPDERKKLMEHLKAEKAE